MVLKSRILVFILAIALTAPVLGYLAVQKSNENGMNGGWLDESGKLDLPRDDNDNPGPTINEPTNSENPWILNPEEFIEEVEDKINDYNPNDSAPAVIDPLEAEGPEMGMLEILLTDAPIDDIEAVYVHFEAIEVHKEGGGWETYSDVSMEIELLGLQNGLVQSLGLEDLEVGHYSGIRLMVTGAELILYNNIEEVSIPSGEQSGVKLTRGFDVLPGNLTVLTLDFDVKKSLHYSPGKGWIMRPTIALIASHTTPLIGIEDPAQMIGLANLENASLVPMELRFDDVFGVPSFIAGEWLTDPLLTDPGAKALKFMETYSDVFRMNLSVDGFLATSIYESKRLDLVNVRLQQYYRGVPVFGAEQIVHLRAPINKTGGQVLFLNGIFVPNINVDVNPSLKVNQAQVIAETNIRSRLPNVQNVSFMQSELSIYNPSVGSCIEDGTNTLTWLLIVQIEDPDEQWHYFVDAKTGNIVDSWGLAPETHPSKVYDANNSASTSNDVLWFQDHVQQQPGTPPAEATRLNNYGHNYYTYLLNTFSHDSINDAGKRLIGRFDYASSSLPPPNACWDCRNDEAVFTPGMVTQDIVAHEFTHGLVEKSAGGLTYKRMSGALNEANADILAEYLDCQTSCNWLVGRDAFSVTASTGVIRSLADPTIYGDPDHIDDLLTFSGSCGSSNDNCGVHTNSGIPNKVGYLIAQGGTHYGVPVVGLGLAKAEQLVFSTLVDSSLSKSATFYEYRDVMLQTCNNMIGGSSGMTKANCRDVFRAWCSVGLCYLTQALALGLNEDNDKFGYSLATGDFNGDTYDDLAVGTPYEDWGSKSNAGIVYAFYGSQIGITSTWAEIITQSEVGGLIESGDKFGYALTSGNFNGDAFDDLAISAPYENYAGKSDTGIVFILYGALAGLRQGTSSSWELISQTAAGATNEKNDKYGWSLTAGNFNNDAYDDLAVGVPYEDHSGKDNVGRVDIFYGSSSGLISYGSANYERIAQDDVGGSLENNDRFAYSLASGNFNNDAYDDLVVGVPYEHLSGKKDTGMVHILFGSNHGLKPTDYESIKQTTADASNENYDKFGWSLIAGNFNGGVYDDLAVGAPYEDLGNDENTGNVNIFYGGPNGLISGGSASWERLTQESSGATNEDHDKFGWSLAAADFNGDGYDELAVSVPYENFGGKSNPGRIDIFFGSNAGLISGGSSTYVRITEESAGGHEESGDKFGYAVVSGNFDGGVRYELAASSPWENLPGGRTDTGAVYIWEI